MNGPSSLSRLFPHGKHQGGQQEERVPARDYSLDRHEAAMAYTRTAPRLPEPEDVRAVQCEYCKVLGPSTLIPDIGRGHRCSGTDECVRRWAGGGLHKPLPFPEGFSLPLRPAEDAVLDAAMTAFNAAHDAEEAREAAAQPVAATPVEEEPEAVAPGAEPGTEDEEPAPVAEDDPVPVAEVPEPDGYDPAVQDPAYD